MKYESVKMFLKTMCEYNTVTIRQVFSAEDGRSLSVRCLPGTTTFEITDSQTQEVSLNESIEETTQLIAEFIASYKMSTNS